MANQPINFRPTDKTDIYLKEMGFRSKKTGMATKNSLNLTEFVNACIVYCCELAKPPAKTRAGPEELEKAWKKIQVAKRMSKIEDLREEINIIVGTKVRKASDNEVVEEYVQ